MKQRLPFYIWLLPLLWGVCSYIHHSYPGDENAMWLISSVAGLWIAPLVFFAHASKVMIAVYIAIAGAMVMGGVGFVMDLFGVRKTL